MLNIYVGWDSREDVAYQVCKYSILKHSKDVNVIPLKLPELVSRELYYREKDKLGSTEFTFSRFLVPYLNQYKGKAVFVDCDFLFTQDINNVLDHFDESKAVHCVQHNYVPSETLKMDGKLQYVYPRKNWSSFVLWNCEHPSNAQVDINMVNGQSGQFLHRFQWLDDEEIGMLPKTWNWLEGWYNYPDDSSAPAAIHYTRGGPYFRNYTSVDGAELWLSYFEEMTGRKWKDSDFIG